VLSYPTNYIKERPFGCPGRVYKMIIPVRCFTCGKVIGQLYEEYSRRTQAGEDPAKVMDDLHLERYCCRRMFLTHVELIDEVMPFT